MDTRTKIITLVSGMECEIKELETKHQEWVTEGSEGAVSSSGIKKTLADCIVRIGTNKNITEEDVNKLGSADRKKALFHMRQLAVSDIFPSFNFTYTWAYKDGAQSVEEPIEYELPINEKDFEEVKYKRYNDEGEAAEVLVEELSDFDPFHTMVLPRSGKKIRFSVLTGKLEEALGKLKRSDIKSTTLVKARNPQYFEKMTEDNKELYITLDVSKLPLADFEVLKKRMNEVEAVFDTKMEIRHPKRDDLVATVDLLQLVGFFFPSGEQV